MKQQNYITFINYLIKLLDKVYFICYTCFVRWILDEIETSFTLKLLAVEVVTTHSFLVSSWEVLDSKW